MTGLIKRIAFWYIRRRLSAIEGLATLPPGGTIIAANHIDFLDGFFINAAVLVRHWPARVKFITLTGNYWWIPEKTIPLTRYAGAAVLGPACDALRQGDFIVNFPEGKRGDGNGPGPLKNGTARLALLAGVPIVPCYLEGRGGRSFLESLFLLIRGRKMAVRFGEPLPIERRDDPSGEHASALTAKLAARLQALSTGGDLTRKDHVLA